MATHYSKARVADLPDQFWTRHVDYEKVLDELMDAHEKIEKLEEELAEARRVIEQCGLTPYLK